MKRILIICTLAILAVLAGLSACETIIDDIQTADCQDCNPYEPFEDTLYVSLTINDENPRVPLAVYVGKLEYDSLVFRDTADSRDWRIVMPIDPYYTVTAEYHRGNDTILAVDGSDLSKSSYSACDSICWESFGADINVKLKYD